MPDIESIHYPHARKFIEKRFPGVPLQVRRQRVYEQTEALRRWYGGRMWDDPAPYPDAMEGYVYAYMPRGYRWLHELAEQSQGLRADLKNAKSIAVMGAGPAPELWSLCHRVKDPESFVLFDTHIGDWWPVVKSFTLDLLRQDGGEDVTGKVSRGTGADLVPGVKYDIIVAQQVLNEKANSRNEHTSWTVRRWCTSNLACIIHERRESVTDGACLTAGGASRTRQEAWSGPSPRRAVAEATFGEGSVGTGSAARGPRHVLSARGV